tara:strand:- start:172 stop:570 length:399 start_codon:yes stop_codon:yes gene_type:complete
MTDQFLSYTLAQGNNLKDPNPVFNFPGLKPGGRWCLCASRWEQARFDGMPPPVILEATDPSALKIVPFEILRNHAYEDANIFAQIGNRFLLVLVLKSYRLIVHGESNFFSLLVLVLGKGFLPLLLVGRLLQH